MDRRLRKEVMRLTVAYSAPGGSLQRAETTRVSGYPTSLHVLGVCSFISRNTHWF